MMNTILVPMDFSYASRNAAEYAAKLAAQIHADLLLFHAFYVPVPASEFPDMNISEETLHADSEIQLREAAASIEKQTGVVVNYSAKMGATVQAIIDEEKNVIFSVIGMKEKSKLGETLLGSVASSFVKKANKPVFVIPENAVYRAPKNIVLACDYDSDMVGAVDALKYFVTNYGSHVMMLNVNPGMEQILERRMKSKAIENILGKSHVSYHYIQENNLVDGIHNFALEHEADIIAIIPHRYTLIERLFHKSISKKMAFHTVLPLLALPE